MRIFSVLPFTSLLQLAFSSETPEFPHDPNVTKDCAAWHNVGENETCEYVRYLYGITPAEFHEWNPDIGLDCTPWYEWTSYCIITWKKVALFSSSTTSTSVTVSSTTTASSLAPSPTVWDSRGCYAQDTAHPILEQNMSPNGDASLTISKCKDICYHQAYTFAGVQQGNQCWCSNYVAGEWAKNQTDCDTTCAGDDRSTCGGKQALNVFKALVSSTPTTTSSVGSFTGAIESATSSLSTVKAAVSSSVAVKNSVMFW